MQFKCLFKEREAGMRHRRGANPEKMRNQWHRMSQPRALLRLIGMKDAQCVLAT